MTTQIRYIDKSSMGCIIGWDWFR